MTSKENPKAEIFIRARDRFEGYGIRLPMSRWTDIHWLAYSFVPLRDDWLAYFTLYIDGDCINNSGGGIGAANINNFCIEIAKEYAGIMKTRGVEEYNLFNGAEREPTATIGDLYKLPPECEKIFREELNGFREELLEPITPKSVPEQS